MTPPINEALGTPGSMSEQTLTLPRRTIAIRRWAAGPQAEPSVMVHGLGGNSKNWNYLAPLMTDVLDTVALDLPGFGASPPPRDGDYTPNGHAAAVIAAIEESFGGRPVHLFGNSLGGHVSTVVAATRPDLVRSLTLVSPALPSFVPAKASMSVPVTASPVLGPRLLARYHSTPPEQRAIAMGNLVLGDIDLAPQGWLDMIANDMAERDNLTYAQDAYTQSSRGLLRAYLHKGADDAWRDAERVQAPTLLVFGQRDKLVPINVARKARKHFATSRLIVLPDSGHVAQIEHPEIVNAAWRRFATLSDAARSAAL